MSDVTRRTLLAAGLALAACSRQPEATSRPSASEDDAVETVRYGKHPDQFFEVTRAAGGADAVRGVAVVIHGGFWQSVYDLSLGRPLAKDLARRGWHAVNLEYRRVGSGGGRPQTFDDVAAGIDAIADTGLPTERVVAFGHSAGGHLAVWAAGRSDAAVRLAGAVSQAGVLDLVAARGLGNGAVESLMGGDPSRAWAPYDPQQQLPLDVPVRCVHAPDDPLVPIAQSINYVKAATAAGADATLTRVTGGHFDLIDPRADAWASCVSALNSIGR